ncbi:bifunctional glutamine-synthetase adenylyltransferase/deadenyltransferase [Corynebacterium sp. 13CS0277]|uniref:bifunctional [glutamine synthetase] adenylyltransferase/[glutamine synthetase]-adenylyl-L-tyrosine phosphorylase n=1 Tax=Corynebacterium sp. 13CS0277 TaxID=2071994 RepID=UPI000D02CFC7|nr:bifunctional [glutamine synthetase] adenylyltransferase/[glutamine synthetase]-adenylyl-L-tyrosine phosphorylase [Corynebacterium sp. 13CS0277]PRQ10406.1 bifunctional glutamine-synthetase adenylyltransferase/deadenyltransferase [Corynebacterium sp. 13CS0277]
MTSPRSTRNRVPTPGALSLTSPTAGDDFATLGWTGEDAVDLLWSLSGAADPDLALNTMIRLQAALHDQADTLDPELRWDALDARLRHDALLRVRLMALIGGSRMLGDHLVAHPHLWPNLADATPTFAEMMQRMLQAVDARPAQLLVPTDDAVATGGAAAAVLDAGESADTTPATVSAADPASGDGANDYLSTAGTYVAGIGGKDAEKILKTTYRSLLLQIAAADLAGTYLESPRRAGGDTVPFVEVAAQLTHLADAALTAALAVGVRNVYGDSPVDTRLSVIAMGKCGAQELNYISDVDVIFVAEPAHAKATRLAGEFIRIGSVCFFEVDAALRPEGKRGALVRTLDSHVAYYTRWAHTWEFQALLKARPMTGDRALGDAYLAALGPMVWEASQRESFVDDVQKMRTRVIANVPAELQDRELKLGRGGLRDVEFAVQMLQMVHGRSDESLRVRDTVAALEALIEGGYVGREDGSALIGAYEFLRLLEHRLQVYRMKRTHTMPAADDEAALRILARGAGFRSQENSTSAQVLHTEYKRIGHKIAGLHRKLFFRPLLNSVVALPTETLRLSPESARRQLGALGYQFPDRAYEHLTALASGASRKAKIQAMLLPTLMEWLSTTADPDAGLLNYRRLSEACEDKSWFLRTLRDEGVVGQRLMKILGTSPYVSDLILHTPDVVKLLGDGAHGPKLLATNPDTVSRSLIAAAGRYSDPDKAITVARSLRRAELARVAAADVLGLMSVEEVCYSLSLVWCSVLDAALAAEMRAATDDPEAGPPARIAVIGMGRLGGKELGYGSDADVMFVCAPADGVSDSDAVAWSIGICDRMRRRLAKPSIDPPLDVDLGLRPEGRSGAVVRTVASYATYYERWGETWEIQALLRAAVIAGDEATGADFIAAIDPLRYPPQGIDDATVREVRRMKARVDTERLPRGADRNTHTKLGRGALTDIEWTVQLLTLEHAHTTPALHTPSTLTALDVIESEEILPATDVRTLRTAWLTATHARNALVLVRGKRTDQLPQPGPQLAQVAGAAGWDPHEYQEFLENYLKVTRRARRVIDEVFWGETTFEP